MDRAGIGSRRFERHESQGAAVVGHVRPRPSPGGVESCV